MASFDAAGFVGYGTVEEFQDAAEHPSRDIWAASAKGSGIVNTLGGVLRILNLWLNGRYKVDAVSNKRTIFAEDNTAILVEAATFDSVGAPSTDPIFETVTPPDTTPPTVLSTVPTSGAIGVAVNSVVTITFSENMDPLTLTELSLVLKQGATPIDTHISYNQVTKVATIVPNQLMAALTVHNVDVTTAVKDLRGNALSVLFTTSFTTA